MFMLREDWDLCDIAELLGKSFEKLETQGFEFVPSDGCLIGLLFKLTSREV